MVRAIREFVTVGPDGTIRVSAPELRQGVRAEVIVLLGASEAAGVSLTPLQAFDALQRDTKLNVHDAQAWVDQNDRERKASSRL